MILEKKARYLSLKQLAYILTEIYWLYLDYTIVLYRTTECTSVTVSRGLRDIGKTQKPRGRTYGLRYLDPGRVHPRGELKQTVASGTGNHRGLYRSPHRH